MSKITEDLPVTTASQRAKDDRREAIVSAAHDAFLAKGYAGTSMEDIRARFGGSKGTLYTYFDSKEELFAAVVTRKCELVLSLLYDAELEGADVHTALTHFGERFLDLVLADDMIATHRLIVAECGRFPELGRTTYDAGPARGHAQMRKFLSHARDAGQLRPDADIELAADQFFALCLMNIQQRRLWAATSAPTTKQIRKEVEGAVSTFMRAFGA